MRKALTEQELDDYTDMDWLKANLDTVGDCHKTIFRICTKVKQFKTTYWWFEPVVQYPKIAMLAVLILVVSFLNTDLATEIVDRVLPRKPPTAAVLSDSEPFILEGGPTVEPIGFRRIEDAIKAESDAINENIDDGFTEVERKLNIIWERLPSYGRK